MAEFKPKPKERGNVILAQDWNTAMDEIVRVGAQVEILDKSALKPVAGKIPGDINAGGALSVTGNVTIGASGSVFFDNKTRQMLNLWSTGYGVGVQGYTEYFRTDKNFAWYKGGSHNDGELNAGGGIVQMVIKDGNVGIGTAAPGQKFSVTGAESNTDGFAAAIGLSNTAAGGANWYLRVGATGTNTPAGGLSIADDRGYRLVIDNAGNVGINTIKPSAALEVNGTVKAARFEGDGSKLTGLDAVSKSGGTITGALAVGDKLTVKSAVTAASFVGDGSQLTGIEKSPWTAKDGALVYAGGNVGIGIDKPSAALQVNGAIKATSFEGDGSKLTGLDAVSKSGGTIAGALAIDDALTVKTTVTAASFVGDGSKLTGITAADARWVDTTDGIQYRIGKKLTVGAANSGTSLQVINKNQDPSGDTVVIGKSDSTHLRLGYDSGYAWVQSQTDKPLAINPLGGKVGIGTTDPQGTLDVAGGAIVMRQATDSKAADALLDKLPNGSLIVGGPSGETIAFFWKDENGKKYQLSLKGEALTT